MTYPQYLDFDLELTAEGAGYVARVLASPKGEAEAQVTMPFDDDKLENVVLKLGRTRAGVRRLGSPQQALAKTFGSSLYEAVFSGEVGTCFRRSLDEADRQGKGLRLRLRLNDAPALFNVPWEYLYPEGVGHFLVLSQKTPVIRYLDLPREVVPLAIQPPLRVLLVVSGPADLASLDTATEMTNLRTALAGLLERGLVQLDILPEPSLAALRRALRTSTYHVLHFIGHGGYDEAGGDGVVAFEDEHGHSHLVSGGDLGTMLHDHTTLRLAVLNACEGARTSPQDPFSGVAQALVQQGLPAVVAMQFEITDDAAIELSQEFYSALSDGYPVDAALAEGRKAVFGNDNDVEWGTPVLYLRASDGRIFDVSPSMLLSAVGEPAVSEPAVPEPAVPEPAVPEPAVPEPAVPEPEHPAAEDSRPDTSTPAPPSDPPPDQAPPAYQDWFRPAAAAAATPRTAPRPVDEPLSGRPPGPTTTAPARRSRTGVVVLTAIGLILVVIVAATGIGLAIRQLGGTGSTGTSGSTDGTTGSGTTGTDEGTGGDQGTTGVDFGAVRGTASVDGSTNDWAPTAATASSVALVAGSSTGVFGSWWVMWDESALYLLAQVQDPVLTQFHELEPSAMWNGDGVSLELGQDAGRRDPAKLARRGDAHVIFGLTQSGAVINCVNEATGGGGFPAGRPDASIQAVAFAIPGGYGIEAAIPWSSTTISPGTGTVVSVNFDVSDANPATGDLAAMVSSNPNRSARNQAHPGTWQRMVLL